MPGRSAKKSGQVGYGGVSKRRKYAHCPNCGQTLLADNHYCPHCGQPNHDLRVPLKRLLSESIEDLFHFDSKSLRTIRALLFKPGFLTAEFVAGKRASYVSPIRLYVFVSFLFFLLLNVSMDKGGSVTPSQDDGASESKAVRDEFKISVFGISSTDLKGLTVAQVDSLMDARGIARTRLSRRLILQAARIGIEGTTDFVFRLLKGISYMMFVLMPVFALFVYWFNRKHAGYYLNCLIFSIHFHSATFILLIVLFIVSMLFDSVVVLLASPIFIAIHGLLALRRFIPQSWKLTVLKTSALSVIYVFSLTFTFLLTVLANLLTY